MKNPLLGSLLALILCGGLAETALAQDTGKSLLAAARKRATEARGLDAEAKAAIYEDVLRLLARIPKDFPEERPAVARAWLETGRFERRLDRPERAEAAFRRVLEFPDEASPMCDALHDLASLLRRKKEYAAATELLQRLVDEYPKQEYDRARAFLRLASLERQAKRPEVAAGHLERVLAEHPGRWRQCVDALDDLVLLRVGQGEHDAARQLLERHEAEIRERFAGGKSAERVARALDGMRCRTRLDG